MKKYFRLLLEAIHIIRLYRNWFEIISNHFEAGKETSNLVLRNGVKFIIHPKSTDMGLIQEIFSENIYQIQKGDIGHNGVVIDIGAHIGVFSVLAATWADNVTVYSFEPEPDNFQLLVENTRINHLENSIKPFNIAVSDKSTPRILLRSASSLSAHSFFPNKFPAGDIKDRVEVSCTTLADIFRNNAIGKCDVLKLDCEGEEYNILLHAPDEILLKIMKIVAEYHDGLTEYDHQDLVDFLQNRGFEVRIEKSRVFSTFSVGFLYAVKRLLKTR
jgi:FkbM family methyltransferase